MIHIPVLRLNTFIRFPLAAKVTSSEFSTTTGAVCGEKRVGVFFDKVNDFGFGIILLLKN